MTCFVVCAVSTNRLADRMAALEQTRIADEARATSTKEQMKADYDAKMSKIRDVCTLHLSSLMIRNDNDNENGNDD
jgi:hypothetical protein